MRIGLLLSRSGPSGLWSAGCEAAGMFAAAELNSAGGVLGNAVDLVISDAGPSPQTAARAAAELVSHRVDAVVGLQPSHMRAPVRRGLAGVAPYIYTPQYEGGFCGPGTVGIGLTDGEVLAPAIAWLCRRRKSRRFFFVGNDYVWPRVAHGTALAAVAAAGGTMVGEALLPFGLTDHAATLDRMRACRPDVVISVLLGEEAVRFHRAFGAAGLDRSILRFALALDETLLLAIGAENTGNLLAAQSFFHRDADGPEADLAAAYAEAFGATRPQLNAFGLGCHQGVLVAARLAQSERTTDGRSLARAVGRCLSRKAALSLIGPPRTRPPVRIAEADGVWFRLRASL